jgi:hypothetical protein
MEPGANRGADPDRTRGLRGLFMSEIAFDGDRSLVERRNRRAFHVPRRVIEPRVRALWACRDLLRAIWLDPTLLPWIRVGAHDAARDFPTNSQIEELAAAFPDEISGECKEALLDIFTLFRVVEAGDCSSQTRDWIAVTLHEVDSGHILGEMISASGNDSAKSVAWRDTKPRRWTKRESFVRLPASSNALRPLGPAHAACRHDNTRMLRRGVQELGLVPDLIASIIGMSHSRTMEVLNGESPIDPRTKASELAHMLDRIFRFLDPLTSFDPDRIRFDAWMASAHQGLAATPRELVRRADGLCSLAAYVHERLQQPTRKAG